jgi:hypothetical protein
MQAWLIDHDPDRRIEGGESLRDMQARFAPFIHGLVAAGPPTSLTPLSVLPLASQTVTDTIDPPDDLDAVRRSYDAVADNYVSMGIGDLGPTPWLLAALNAFAEQVRGIGPVLDAGCGPGTTSGYLHALGLEVSGIDLSPRMIEHARRLHPGVRFEVARQQGHRLRLPVAARTTASPAHRDHRVRGRTRRPGPAGRRGVGLAESLAGYPDRLSRGARSQSPGRLAGGSKAPVR